MPTGVVPIDRLTDVVPPVEVVAKKAGRKQVAHCPKPDLPARLADMPRKPPPAPRRLRPVPTRPPPPFVSRLKRHGSFRYVLSMG